MLNTPQKLRNTIEAYTGGLGSGKTLSAVARAYELCYAGPVKRQLITNMRSLKFPNAVYISCFKDLEYYIGTANNPGVLNTKVDLSFVLLLDELGIWARASNWKELRTGDDSAYTLTVMMPQLRKRGISLIYTVQRFNTVDGTIKGITNLQVQCKYIHIGVLQKLTLEMDGGFSLGARIMLNNPVIMQNYDTRELVDKSTKKDSHGEFKRFYHQGFLTHNFIPPVKEWEYPNNIIAADEDKYPECDQAYNYFRSLWLRKFDLNLNDVPYYISEAQPYNNILPLQDPVYWNFKRFDIIPDSFQTI